MPKTLVLGNGSMLLGYDKNGYVRDFYFPNVGLENHMGGVYANKVGIFADGKFSWLDSGAWEIKIESIKETLVGSIDAVNKSLEVRVHFDDVVYNEENIYVRRATVYNLSSKPRLIKIFFNQEFQIYGTQFGESAYYDPIHQTIIHYKGRRVFLINAKENRKGFSDYSVGTFGYGGKEGTYKDAEDGELSGNAVEHGSVDSTISFNLDIEANDNNVIYYWIISAKSIQEAYDLNEYIIEKSPDHLIQSTSDYWRAWVNKENFNFFGLNDSVVDLFKKSLLIMRTQVDNNGAIIASSDSDMLQHGRDTYLYMWPRDAAFTVLAFNKAGDLNAPKKFLEFANTLITNEGYFMHKYSPDGSLGSSWHPWLKDGGVALPIQEDETALVIYAFWKYYEKSHDLEFVEKMYNSIIKKAADFMLFYRDKKTGLPHPTYDLWEEKYGISTFTSSTVYGAFLCASKISALLGKKENAEQYQVAAEKLKKAILEHLYKEDENRFYRMIIPKGNDFVIDHTLDASSVYGVFKFGILDIDDEKLDRAMKLVEDKLMCKTNISGIIRYEGDMYFNTGHNAPSNPWILTTLWLAQYYIAKAKSEKDLEIVQYWLEWVVEKALTSGILSEQLNPYTGQQISAAPLTWSHAEFVTTVVEYLEKLEELGIRKVYNVTNKLT